MIPHWCLLGEEPACVTLGKLHSPGSAPGRRGWCSITYVHLLPQQGPQFLIYKAHELGGVGGLEGGCLWGWCSLQILADLPPLQLEPIATK